MNHDDVETIATPETTETLETIEPIVTPESRALKLVELFAIPTQRTGVDWRSVVDRHYCPYRDGDCTKTAKTRKSEPKVYIGSCSVEHNVREPRAIVICPVRFRERGLIFTDCIQLLHRHQPGNDLHIVPEVKIPGGAVDYFLASTYNEKVVDFVGIELQALDTTGSVWPTRQRFLAGQGIEVETPDGGYGMNWKMSAKTILIQLHHKVQTFEHVKRHFVLVLQDHFLNEMRSSFSFGHIGPASSNDTMHFHAYSLADKGDDYRLQLSERVSTDSTGIETSLGGAISPNVELDTINEALEKKIKKFKGSTLMRLMGA